MRAFIFPGQGSQAVGMGRDLAAASAAAREVFQEVDDALGQSLFKLMCEGPEDQLMLTENAQPAIMANAIAVLRVLEHEGGITLADKAQFVAGQVGDALANGRRLREVEFVNGAMDGVDFDGGNHVEACLLEA